MGSGRNFNYDNDELPLIDDLVIFHLEQTFHLDKDSLLPTYKPTLLKLKPAPQVSVAVKSCSDFPKLCFR